MPISQSKSIIVNVDIDWPVPTNIKTNIRKINNNYTLNVTWDVVSPNDPIFQSIGLPGYQSVTWELMINEKVMMVTSPHIKIPVNPGCQKLCLSLIAVYDVCNGKKVRSKPSDGVCITTPKDSYCFNRKVNVTKTKNNVSTKMLYALAVKYPKIAKTQVFKF
mgnify:CR=1 FL=1|tara:strand:- start:159 stop:644 length:486 start_codon:yes stop_codon:yes gene_type:complete